MISFRYHVFTIVAIFLAVGLGIVVGNTFVQPGLVRDLRNRTDSLAQQLADYRARVSQLESQVGQFQEVGDILPVLDNGGLVGKPVVIVTHDGVDPGLLAEARDALDAAHADLVAVFSATDRLAATDVATQQSLADVLQMPQGTASADLEQRAAFELAQRLSLGLPRPVGGTPARDVLDELLKAGFLSFPSGFPKVSGSALPQLGGQGELIVVISGGQGDPAIRPEDFMVPLTEELDQRGSLVAAGESSTTTYSFVGLLRAASSGTSGSTIVTVDDLDFSVGGAALVLGFERMLLTGQGGDYGIKAGASGPIPPR